MRKFLFWLSRKVNYPLVGPDIIQISLTYRCNLRCKMCSIVNLLPKEEELSTKQIFHIIDESRNYDIKEVLFTGGEPFLRNDIFEACLYVHNRGLRSIVTTNGTLINKDMAEKIAESGISHIHISLEGLEETNDSFRGRGVFNKIIDTINILSMARKNRRSFSIGIATTVMDSNVGELSELVKLGDNLDIDVISFQPLVRDNANFSDKHLPSFWIKEENIAILKEEINKIRSYKPRRIYIHEEPHLELLVKYYQGKLSRRDWICFGGFKTAFICHAKNEPLVYSCHGVCGNLNNISLKRAWTSKEAFGLRLHSKRCKEPCLQSCYSLEAANNANNLKRFYIGEFNKRSK